MNPLSMHMTRWLPALGRTLTLTAVLSASASALAQDAPPPSEMYVFNGGDDSFYGYTTKGMNAGNTTAYGAIMQTMGLLGANGQPPEVGADGLLLQGETVVGRVIEAPPPWETGLICGFETLDGSKRAYDLSRGGTFRRAWEEVADNGTITVIKHGLEVVDSAGTPTQQGGALTLDNGVMYDGFRSDSDTGSWGTGNLGNGPYAVTGRPGANIHIKLVTCYAANDYDGPAGGISVLDTLNSIPGVGSAVGETDLARAARRIELLDMPSAVQERTFYRALDKVAADRGFRKSDGTPDRWALLKSLSFLSMHLVLDWAGEQAGVEYRATFYLVADPDHEVRIEPMKTGAIDGTGGLLIDVLPDGDDPETAFAHLWVPQDAVLEQTPIQIAIGSLDPAIIPEGLAPVAPAVTIARYGVDDTLEFMIPSELMLEYPALGPDSLGLFRVEPDGSLVQVMDAWIDPLDNVAGTEITQNGTYVLLGDAVEDRPADFNLDRKVDVEDLLEIVDTWGACTMPWCQHDLDGDGQVAIDDLMALLGQWGSDFSD